MWLKSVWSWFKCVDISFLVRDTSHTTGTLSSSDLKFGVMAGSLTAVCDKVLTNWLVPTNPDRFSDWCNWRSFTGLDTFSVFRIPCPISSSINRFHFRPSAAERAGHGALYPTDFQMQSPCEHWDPCDDPHTFHQSRSYFRHRRISLGQTFYQYVMKSWILCFPILYIWPAIAFLLLNWISVAFQVLVTSRSNYFQCYSMFRSIPHVIKCKRKMCNCFGPIGVCIYINTGYTFKGYRQWIRKYKDWSPHLSRRLLKRH